MKGFFIALQQGRTCARIKKILESNNWIVEEFAKEDTIDPTRIDEDGKIKIYSRNDDETHLIMPNSVADILPGEFINDNSFLKLLQERGHDTKPGIAKEFSDLLSNAKINNKSLIKELDEVERSMKIFEGYRCISMLIRQK